MTGVAGGVVMTPSTVLLIFVEHVSSHQIPDLLVLADCFLPGEARSKGTGLVNRTKNVDQHGKPVCSARSYSTKTEETLKSIGFKVGYAWMVVELTTTRMSDIVHGYLWMHRIPVGCINPEQDFTVDRAGSFFMLSTVNLCSRISFSSFLKGLGSRHENLPHLIILSLDLTIYTV